MPLPHLTFLISPPTQSPNTIGTSSLKGSIITRTTIITSRAWNLDHPEHILCCRTIQRGCHTSFLTEIGPHVCMLPRLHHTHSFAGTSTILSGRSTLLSNKTDKLFSRLFLRGSLYWCSAPCTTLIIRNPDPDLARSGQRRAGMQFLGRVPSGHSPSHHWSILKSASDITLA